MTKEKWRLRTQQSGTRIPAQSCCVYTVFLQPRPGRPIWVSRHLKCSLFAQWRHYGGAPNTQGSAPIFSGHEVAVFFFSKRLASSTGNYALSTGPIHANLAVVQGSLAEAETFESCYAGDYRACWWTFVRKRIVRRRLAQLGQWANVRTYQQ